MRIPWSVGPAPRRALPFVVMVLLLSGCLGDTPAKDVRTQSFDDPATDPLYPLFAGIAAAPELRFETDQGTFRMLLYTELMPRTAARIGMLAGEGFYDGTIVHRVVDDFVIQGGDPSGTGMLGSGETIAFESHPDLHFGFGAVGLARDLDPDSGDSQWFVTERPAPHLHAPRGTTGAVFGDYALFGQVFDGMDIVRRIAAVPVAPGLDRPVEDVVVQKATLLPPPADLDPLHHPRRLEGPYPLGVGEALLERPLHLFAGHPAPLLVELTPAEGATPPADLTLVFSSGAQAVNLSLEPLPDDPWVYQGVVALPAAGAWEMTVATSGVVGGPTTVSVERLGPALLGLLRTPTDG